MSKSLCNISIDDVSPHPLSSIRVVRQCERLLMRYPGCKFTLFVPTAYWRTVRGTPDTTTAAALNISKFPEFCVALRDLPKSSYEVCYHGHHHGILGQSNNDELQRLTYDDALRVIDAMFEEVHKAGLVDVFKPVLRPPAWRMSADAIYASRDRGIRTLALSPDDYAKATYGGADDVFRRVVYYTWPRHAQGIPKLELQPKMGLVYHACVWDKTHLNDRLADELIEFIDANHESLEFCFIEDLL